MRYQHPEVHGLLRHIMGLYFGMSTWLSTWETISASRRTRCSYRFCGHLLWHINTAIFLRGDTSIPKRVVCLEIRYRHSHEQRVFEGTMGLYFGILKLPSVEDLNTHLDVKDVFGGTMGFHCGISEAYRFGISRLYP
jgi:hypothetical protein